MRGSGDEGVSELMTMMCDEKWHNSEEEDENAKQSDKDPKDAIRVVYYKNDYGMCLAFTERLLVSPYQEWTRLRSTF
jgi:hypothetical protein